MLKLITAIALSLVLNTTAHALSLEEAQTCAAPDYSALEATEEFVTGMQVFEQVASSNREIVETVIGHTYVELAKQAETCENFIASQLSYFSNLASVSYTALQGVQAGTLTNEEATSKIVEALESVVRASLAAAE